jgi:hypothetical protein
MSDPNVLMPNSLHAMEAPAEPEYGNKLELIFNGRRLFDKSHTFMSWGASSGLIGNKRKMIKLGAETFYFQEDYRYAYYQNLMDHGPLPEGTYRVMARLDPGHEYAHFRAKGCELEASGYIEKIPRGGSLGGGPTRTTAGDCEPFWQNWGNTRVALAPIKIAYPGRSGFYLHDSTKGFSHGCIETETRFFEFLIRLVKSRPRLTVTLHVSYPDGAMTRTYGGTNQLVSDEANQQYVLDRIIAVLDSTSRLPRTNERSPKGEYTFLGNEVADAKDP